MRTLPLLFLLAACASAPGREQARAELLTLHAAQQRAHLDEDAAGLVSLLDDGFCELRDGRMLRPTRAELEARFQSYFDAVEFLAWDDLEPPRIELAEDGTHATMAVKSVRFEAWREVEGLLLPERVVAVDGKGDWVMELATVQAELDGGTGERP